MNLLRLNEWETTYPKSKKICSTASIQGNNHFRLVFKSQCLNVKSKLLQIPLVLSRWACVFTQPVLSGGGGAHTQAGGDKKKGTGLNKTGLNDTKIVRKEVKMKYKILSYETFVN